MYSIHCHIDMGPCGGNVVKYVGSRSSCLVFLDRTRSCQSCDPEVLPCTELKNHFDKNRANVVSLARV